jgi:hypothetical protein
MSPINFTTPAPAATPDAGFTTSVVCPVCRGTRKTRQACPTNCCFTVRNCGRCGGTASVTVVETPDCVVRPRPKAEDGATERVQ